MLCVSEIPKNFSNSVYWIAIEINFALAELCLISKTISLSLRVWLKYLLAGGDSRDLPTAGEHGLTYLQHIQLYPTQMILISAVHTNRFPINRFGIWAKDTDTDKMIFWRNSIFICYKSHYYYACKNIVKALKNWCLESNKTSRCLALCLTQFEKYETS